MNFHPLSRIASAIGGLLALAGAAPAMAADSTLQTNFEYHLQIIDLDPNDGITAGFTYFDNFMSPWLGVQLHTPGSDQNYVSPFDDNSPVLSANLQAAGAQNQVRLVAGSQMQHQQTLSGSGNLQGIMGQSFQFGLTANTRLQITGTESVHATLDPNTSLTTDHWIAYYGWQDQAEGRYGFQSAQQGGSLHHVQDFTLTLDNLSANSAGYYLYNNSSASLSNVAAVPEADTWAMLGGGLLLLGALARRRKQA